MPGSTSKKKERKRRTCAACGKVTHVYYLFRDPNGEEGLCLQCHRVTLRMELYWTLGGQCVVCGDDSELHGDHVDDIGNAHRALLTKTHERFELACTDLLQRMGKKGLLAVMQLLCPPHHHAKGRGDAWQSRVEAHRRIKQEWGRT